MHRRNFFAMLFGGLLAKWLPKSWLPSESPAWTKSGIAMSQVLGAGPTRVDMLDMDCWGKAVGLDSNLSAGEAFRSYQLYGIGYYRAHGESFQNLERSRGF